MRISKRIRKEHKAVLPAQLLRTGRRRVRLSKSGFVLLLWAIVLFAAGPWAGYLLHTHATAPEGVPADGEVIDVQRKRGDSSRFTVTFRYSVEGRQYQGTNTVRRRGRDRYNAGTPVRLRYAPSEPGKSWIEGHGRRRAPILLAFLAPPAMILTALAMMVPIRRQSRLLAEGRFALATVTKLDNRVHYEWILLSGGTRSGRYDVGEGKPPAPGTTVPILYDRDNPQRHARYPMCLVTVAD